MKDLGASDWELDPATGELWRLGDADRRVAWPAAKVVVAYVAGYRLPGDPQRDLPEDRPPARSPDQGIASADYWVPATGDGAPMSP